VIVRRELRYCARMRVLIVTMAVLASCAPGIRPEPAAVAPVAAPATPAAAAPAIPDLGSAWAPFQILAGDWDGTGDGATGPSHGHFSLVPDLDGHVLVRRSTNISGTTHHVDLMIIYATGTTYRAVYFDEEGHQITYAVTPSASGTGLVFLSEELAGAPRFRLTYEMSGDHGVVSFELSPPGASDFHAYVSGSLHR
jgi:hypothetical protein